LQKALDMVMVAMGKVATMVATTVVVAILVLEMAGMVMMQKGEGCMLCIVPIMEFILLGISTGLWEEETSKGEIDTD